MSTPIAGVGQLVAVIRSELSKAAAPGAALAGSCRRTEAQGKRYAEPNLAGLIEVRIRQIGRDDPQRGRKAFRVFLEAVLLSSFGERMVVDPKFHQIVDDVQRAMETQAECAGLIDEAIKQLLARNG